MRLRQFGGPLLARDLVEHGVDHARLGRTKEGAGDIDIFLDDDARRHILARPSFIGAGAQHRAHHRLKARQRPAAG